MAIKSEAKHTKYDVTELEQNYRNLNRTGHSLFLSVIFGVLIIMAYALFGTRSDREKLTTDVTPVHVEVNPISDNRQTAASARSFQL